jgi:ABC-type sulfate transport system permease subunit
VDTRHADTDCIRVSDSVFICAAGGGVCRSLKKGWQVYLEAIVEPDALSAIKLTLIAAGIAVPLNLIFGVAAAWTIANLSFAARAFY